MATYTFTDETDTDAVGSAVNTSDETVIRATSAIMHEDSNAERLLIREIILCMAGGGPRTCFDPVWTSHLDGVDQFLSFIVVSRP